MTGATFGTFWRPLAGIAAAMMIVALLAGTFTDGSWPAWIFGLGLAFALIAVASLVTGLTLCAKETIEDVLDGGDDDPSPPGGRPTIRRNP